MSKPRVVQAALVSASHSVRSATSVASRPGISVLGRGLGLSETRSTSVMKSVPSTRPLVVAPPSALWILFIGVRLRCGYRKATLSRWAVGIYASTL